MAAQLECTVEDRKSDLVMLQAEGFSTQRSRTKMGQIGRITRIAMEIIKEDGIINNARY